MTLSMTRSKTSWHAHDDRASSSPAETAGAAFRPGAGPWWRSGVTGPGAPPRRPCRGTGRRDGDGRCDRRAGSGPLRELSRWSRPISGRSTWANGGLHQAVRALKRGAGARGPSPARDDCSGGWPTSRRSRVISAAPPARRSGSSRATWPRARVSSTRTSPGRGSRWNTRTSRRRVGASMSSPARTEPDQEPWLATSRLLVEAQLLIATGSPTPRPACSPVRLEVASAPGPGLAGGPRDDRRAEALLASGEPQRALATVTPCRMRRSSRPPSSRRPPAPASATSAARRPF